jgi:putative pyruvate formate lyase activating enzyme
MVTLDVDNYQACHLCPRNCGVNRNRGEKGFCRETAECRIASSFAHFGEEPFFSGTRGSGTIFFTGCSTRCFFCQNYDISLLNQGRVIDLNQLLDITQRLIKLGVHNINFVTPDHFWPHIKAVCKAIRAEGHDIPFVYNCSGYAKAEIISEVAEYIDIFMPDYKFADRELSQLCIKDSQYPELALNAIKEMVRQRGFLRPWDISGRNTAQEGVVIRHLLMPGFVENSLNAMQYLFEAFGPEIPLSILSQYRPTERCFQKGMLTNMISRQEYLKVKAKIEELEFNKVYMQPFFGI